MSLANKYNRGNKFEIDTTGFEYHKLSELNKGEVYPIAGFFISTKGQFGPQPVAILKDSFVNLPQHCLQAVNDMLMDDEAIATIKAGKFGFSVREYQDKQGVKRLSVTWEDIT